MAESHPPEDSPDENENIRLLPAHFHETEQARMEDAKKRLRAEIIPALANHRVANIEAAYCGYGASGAIDGIQYRDELLDRELFLSLPEARVVLDQWRMDYNHRRPHGGLKWLTPAAFVAGLADTASGAVPAA